MTERLLTEQERELVAHLLARSADHARLLNDLAERRVQQLDDGGMGSLQFVSERTARKFGSTVAEVTFKDADGVSVGVALTLDELDDLYELDVWKVDFSPVQRLPAIEDLQVSD